MSLNIQTFCDCVVRKAGNSAALNDVVVVVQKSGIYIAFKSVVLVSCGCIGQVSVT